MLYVFHVDAGLMTTYDMGLTLESVSSLKSAIERKTKIPASSLVLLVSGGEVLQSDHMVSSYSAGTDTNPIYMFSKPSVKDGSLKQSTQYSVCDLSPIVELSADQWRSDTRSGLEAKSVGELKSAVEMCCALPPSVHTVATCATLAQQFSELAHDVSRCCEQLVHDQHLQHQGWSAVVANLEDIFNEFCERSKNFKESFKKHRQKKEFYHEQLNALNEVLESLGKIPILPALKQNAEAHRFSAFDVFEDAAAEFEGHCERIAAPLDDSSEHRAVQDFGVEAFKMSEEDVFETDKQSVSSKQSRSAARLEESDEGETFKAQSFEKEEPTLLHWILAQGNKASLQDILDYCQKGLSLIDADPLKEREAELCHILEYANVHGLKQIKGIEERLYGLDTLLSDGKRLERDQRDQAASLIQNRERVSSTACDPSVLPTLVQSHRCQLEKLLKNHQLLVDIRRRIAKSKDELSHILKARLEAVLMIENSMSVQDAHQMLSYQCCARLARYFDIVQQLHRAPAVFVRAVAEVARRRTFSHAFLTWATDLATNLLKIHEEEISRRQEFNDQFHGHFLKSLFPGMSELPPPFATQAPPVFDSRIPKITEVEVGQVTSSFPDLVKDIPQHDMEATVKFFKQRFSTTQYEDKDVQSDLDKYFDSETEAGDFERLSRQSTSEAGPRGLPAGPLPPGPAAPGPPRAVATLTEVPEPPEFDDSQFYIDDSPPSSYEWGRDEKDNMDTHRINIAKLKDLLIKLFEICKVNVLFIREDLAKLKYEMEEQKKIFKEKYFEVLQALEKNDEETALKFREQTQRLTVDHELELSDLKNVLCSKDEVIDSIKMEKEILKSEHQTETDRLIDDHETTKEELEKTRSLVKTFEDKIVEIESRSQRDLKDLQDKLHMEYKAEIESLRSRFRLVALTNMDRSPSESSLEKIERTDVIEISSHNAIVMQTKENAEVEKDEAIRLERERCEQEWQAKMNEELSALKLKYETEKQVTINEVTRRLLCEKDRQLELLRERESGLARECIKYRETIQQLTDPETNDYDSLLKSQLATLENENKVLQQQIQDLKKELEKKTEEAEKSKEEDSDGRSSPKRDVVKARPGGCHTPVGLAAGALSLSSCLPGLAVLLLWDPHHHNYTVMQEASIMYFVHSDCLAALELSLGARSERERRLYAVAVVESKEYCYAKKSGNRYHMPRGSRFYRVRVKPYRHQLAPPPCCDHRHNKQDCMTGAPLAVLCEPRPKKWLTYMHAPDSQRSVDTSQSTSSNTEEAKVGEVATATLINLESPAGAGQASAWAGRMQASSASAITDMECSVGRVPGAEPPAELTARAGGGGGAGEEEEEEGGESELAEEATP